MYYQICQVPALPFCALETSLVFLKKKRLVLLRTGSHVSAYKAALLFCLRQFPKNIFLVAKSFVSFTTMITNFKQTFQKQFTQRATRKKGLKQPPHVHFIPPPPPRDNSPSSVFFASAYTESTYAALTFSALLAMERSSGGNGNADGNVDGNAKKKSFSFTSAALFALASATRSNGALNVVLVMGHFLRSRYFGERERIVPAAKN